jgi:diaminopimelate decarboxylase
MRGEFGIAPDVVCALADQHGTPLFVYDGDALQDGLAELHDRLDPSLEIFYSLKANPNVSVCAVLHAAGARAEVSSLVELLTARRAGVAPGDIIFLGPGKSREEIRACVAEGIFAIVAESLPELDLIDEVAREAGRTIDVMLRVNPAFAVKGSRLTMGGKARQFGIDETQLLAATALPRRLQAARVVGVHAYMGTRILDPAVVAENTARILDMAERIAWAMGFELRAVDVGGGLGVAYFDGECDPCVEELAQALNPVLQRFRAAHPSTRLMMELGRYLTARAGLYVIRARYVKTSHDERFVIADGGTNHHMAAVGIGSFVKRNFPMVALSRHGDPADADYTVTGPLCTPNDTVAKHVALPRVRPGDLLGVARSGAYGPTASPGLFLSHGYPAEVIVHRGRAHLARRRDAPEDLLRSQHLLDVSAEPALVA